MPGQLGQLSHKGAVGDKRLIRAIGAALSDADLAGEQNKGARRDKAGRENVLTGCINSPLSETADPVDLRCRQHRKDLVAAVFD